MKEATKLATSKDLEDIGLQLGKEIPTVFQYPF
jgi:hypothetical protein